MPTHAKELLSEIQCLIFKDKMPNLNDQISEEIPHHEREKGDNMYVTSMKEK